MAAIHTTFVHCYKMGGGSPTSTIIFTPPPPQTLNGSAVLSKRSEIRFPADRGIAGHCARLGETVNVVDAYADPRFNADVDRKTGYRSRGLLAVPVKTRRRVLGVLQVVNKFGRSRTGEELGQGDPMQYVVRKLK